MKLTTKQTKEILEDTNLIDYLNVNKVAEFIENLPDNDFYEYCNINLAKEGIFKTIISNYNLRVSFGKSVQILKIELQMNWNYRFNEGSNGKRLTLLYDTETNERLR